MHLLITDKLDPLFTQLLNENNITYEIDVDGSEEDTLKKINYFNGLIVRNRLNIDEHFLHQAKNLKFIARYGSGMELINTACAARLNIECFNSGEGNGNSVGEHALGMILCLFHRIHNSMEQLKKNIWDRKGNQGIELEGKTIGIIGYGNTGKAFCEKLKGLNCSIMVYDKYKNNFSDESVQESSLKDLYKYCNIISFHIPLNGETIHFMNNDFIHNMLNSFYIINTSRGKIINTKHLIKGLKEKKILGAALDVHEHENRKFNNINIDEDFNYLLNCDNVIMTPHIAGLSKEASEKISRILIEKIKKLI